VELVLRNQETIEVPLGEKVYADTRAESLCVRLKSALERHRHSDPQEDTAMVERQGRSADDWLLRLRTIGEGANVTQRRAFVDSERLWRIVESPALDAAARAGAAIALSTRLDGEGKRRLRIASEATVHPQLRIAFESAAEADEQRMLAALDEVACDAVRQG
jgi:hypothetical protein